MAAKTIRCVRLLKYCNSTLQNIRIHDQYLGLPERTL